VKTIAMKKLLLPVLFLLVLSVVLSGCTSVTNKNIERSSDVKLEGFSHYEALDLQQNYVSTLTFTLQNTGNVTAQNVILQINIENISKDEIYNKELILNSSLQQKEVQVLSVHVPYTLHDSKLYVNIDIIWDGGVNNYMRSFNLSLYKFANVVLDNMLHYESYNSSYGYETQINFFIQNKGNTIANNVEIHVVVSDYSGAIEFDNSLQPIISYLPGEIRDYKITIPYDNEGFLLNLSITINWNGGVNYINRSFIPKFREYADVVMESMTHYEHYKLFEGYRSTVTFVIQNTGNENADSVQMHLIIYDKSGNQDYNYDAIMESFMAPGEIKSYEFTIPYDINDTFLNLNLTVSWDGGKNAYSETFKPKI